MSDTQDALDELPVLTLGACTKCGARRDEWTACNIDGAGNVTDCDRCEERKQ